LLAAPLLEYSLERLGRSLLGGEAAALHPPQAAGSAWVGTVVALERVAGSTVEAMLEKDPFARAGLYGRAEIHLWRFGGRR
jgi:hypothetical protein